jgi:hypothetical protein
MRSVLTILILLVVLGLILLYKMGRPFPTFEGFGGSRGLGQGGGYGSGIGILSYFGYNLANEEPIVEAEDIEERPCSTDLDCPTGHCSMFGMCTNGLSL